MAGLLFGPLGKNRREIKVTKWWMSTMAWYMTRPEKKVISEERKYR